MKNEPDPTRPGVVATHGIDPEHQDRGAPKAIDPKTGQHESYWTLSEEERAKGFIRPVRRSYVHAGRRPTRETRPLTDEEAERYKERFGYVAFEPSPDDSSVTGSFWTEAQLNSGCGGLTTMSTALAETYASQPDFYGSTFCATCKKHFPVGEAGEFVWDGAAKERVGT